VLVEGLPPGPPQVPLAFQVPQEVDQDSGGLGVELSSQSLVEDGHSAEEVGQDSEDVGQDSEDVGHSVELAGGAEELQVEHTPAVSG
jgi:hypothetical protein